jgi:glycerol-3-phosphate acyltransferase PlsX
MRIAVDAMGGDHAPQAVVAGALAAVKEWNLEVILVGPEERIRAELAAQGAAGDPRISIHHAPELIGMDEKEPVKAVRSKKNSSMVQTMVLAKEGKADAALTAGSSGAMMAAALFTIGRLKGIERPAFGTLLPTRGKPTLLLDVGANADNRPQHLVQFGVMGAVYVRSVLGVENPTVALLNIGTEEEKGNELTKATYPLLKESGLNFVGNLEPRELPNGKVDVVVADGIVGNVVLKLYEGMGLSLFAMIKEAIMSTARSRLGGLLVKPALKGLAKRMDYAETGGAPLLGLKAPVIKCHGSSDARAIKNGLRVCKELVAGRAVERIAAEVAAFAAARGDAGDE